MSNLFFSIIKTLIEHPLRFFFFYAIVFTALFGSLAIYGKPILSLFPYDSLLMFGIVAGLLQLLGYILYLSIQNIDPNPVTWFMFAYGTAILTVLEWDAHATLPELILPTVCAVLAVVVSFRCWTKARRLDPTRWWPEDWWPEDKWERWSFVSDILITIGYVSAWILVAASLLPEAYMYIAVLTFLFLSNLSTFPSFYPLLRETYIHPHKEHWAPWAVWALAYAILGFVTYSTHGDIFHPLMFYPVSNAVMHGLVAFLSLSTTQNKTPINSVVTLTK
jgi:hypothetical protein